MGWLNSVSDVILSTVGGSKTWYDSAADNARAAKDDLGDLGSEIFRTSPGEIVGAGQQIVQNNANYSGKLMTVNPMLQIASLVVNHPVVTTMSNVVSSTASFVAGSPIVSFATMGVAPFVVLNLPKVYSATEIVAKSAWYTTKTLVHTGLAITDGVIGAGLNILELAASEDVVKLANNYGDDLVATTSSVKVEYATEQTEIYKYTSKTMPENDGFTGFDIVEKDIPNAKGRIHNANFKETYYEVTKYPQTKCEDNDNLNAETVAELNFSFVNLSQPGEVADEILEDSVEISGSQHDSL